MCSDNRRLPRRSLVILAILGTVIVAVASSALAQDASAGSPIESLPPHITRITHFGQRADWSHDGKRILFIERTFGDVFEVDVKTKTIRPITHHYFHEGYTRALYLVNGDILLSGSRTFDAEDPWPSRGETAELWVLDKSLTKPPVPLGEFCSEGPAVSRTKMTIAWAVVHDNYPDRLPEDVSQIWMADIVYDDGKPAFMNKKKILDSRDLPFECTLEAQNFRPPDEKEITFSAYGWQGGEVMGVDIESGKVVNYSRGIMSYEEPEGIFPDGQCTTVERAPDAFEGRPALDIWRLRLDAGREEPEWTQVTFFSKYPPYRGTNPVISDDGRFMAFQMARATDAAGVGYGIFIYDLTKAPIGKSDAP
jgi:hypothetical protein